MDESVVITGIGMVTPLGNEPRFVLERLLAGESAGAAPTRFDAGPFACPVCAEVKDFRPHDYVAEPKLVRLMNREAQFAVVAAHRALDDSGLASGAGFGREDIALYGATGLAGLPVAEIAPLIEASATAESGFDLGRFGAAGLRTVSPLLSFKILGNMPLCFVSICERIQGPNAIYTPWEGQGAQAIDAGWRAVRTGENRTVLVGGCDVKTHELAFLALEQQGLFRSWKAAASGERMCCGATSPKKGGTPGPGVRNEHAPVAGDCPEAQGRASLPVADDSWREASDSRTPSESVRPAGPPAPRAWEAPRGVVPAEGAVFLVLETEHSARKRSARVYAVLSETAFSSTARGENPAAAQTRALSQLRTPRPRILIGAADADVESRQTEVAVLMQTATEPVEAIHPKPQVGNLFAAAAALQVAFGAQVAALRRERVLAHCFGHGTEQGAFVLEPT